MPIILDIETVKSDNQSYLSYKSGNLQGRKGTKDEEKIAKQIEEKQKAFEDKCALSPLTGKIILIGMLSNTSLTPDTSDKDDIIETEIGNVQYSLAKDGDEKFLLTNFWQTFSDLWDNGHQPLATYNGKQFDIPFIVRRSLILGLEKPKLLPSIDSLLYKYSNREHIDIYNVLTANSSNKEDDIPKKGTLNEWSYLTGDSNILEPNAGNEIGKWYENNEMDKIIEKNKLDLFKSFFLYHRVKSWL